MCGYEQTIHKYMLYGISGTKNLKGQIITINRFTASLYNINLISICHVLSCLIKASDHTDSLEQLNYERLDPLVYSWLVY